MYQYRVIIHQNSQNLAKIIMYIKNFAIKWQLLEFEKIGRNNSRIFYSNFDLLG
jgi:hypothetical protein